MDKNTRKFIWNILWGFMFLVGAMIIGAKADSLYDWAICAASIIFSALHLQKVEQTLKED